MTKADRIRELYRLGWSPNEIAREINCRVEYVRVCAQQRKDGRSSAGDKNYAHRKAKLNRQRYWTDLQPRIAAIEHASRARKAMEKDAQA